MLVKKDSETLYDKKKEKSIDDEILGKSIEKTTNKLKEKS